MVDGLTVATLVGAGLASLFMAWAIGAGSSGSTPFAPAVGAGAISIMRAGFLVGILGLAGAVLQGANVTEAVGKELVLGTTLGALGAVVALTIATVLVALGVFRGYPIATAFTVTGAVIGAGLALGGAPAWGKYTEIGALWLGTPFIGGGLSYATARLLRSEHVAEVTAVPLLAGLVGMAVAHMPFALLGSGGQGASMAQALVRDWGGPTVVGLVAVTALAGLLAGGVMASWMRRDEAQGQFRFLLLLGALVAFSAGGSQVGLALGPLLPLVEPFGVPVVWLLVLGGIGLLAGSWTVATRMIKALAQDYSALGPRRSIAALIPSFLIAQAAVTLGVPVSFNEIVVSAIVGSGYAAGTGSVSSAKLGGTVVAWVASFVVALAASYGLVAALGALGWLG